MLTVVITTLGTSYNYNVAMLLYKNKQREKKNNKKIILKQILTTHGFLIILLRVTVICLPEVIDPCCLYSGEATHTLPTLPFVRMHCWLGTGHGGNIYSLGMSRHGKSECYLLLCWRSRPGVCTRSLEGPDSKYPSTCGNTASVAIVNFVAGEHKQP